MAGLLRSRRFLPLFLVQFFGAFNDQLFQKAFVALLTYRLGEATGLALETLGVIASALFILPFAIVAPTAGQIADRVDKARMMRWTKFQEVVVMGLAVVGFHLQNVPFLYAVLFLMGAQSALFAPIKYAILPQHLSRGELLAGNGLVQGATFLAILLGAIAGTELILGPGGVTVVSTAVVAVALAGWAASFFAPPAPPQGPAEAVDWLIPRAIWGLVADCRRVAPAWRAMLSIAWFWFLGATFLALLPAYVRQTLGADQTVVTVLLAAFSIGVALGSAVSVRLAPRMRPGLAAAVGAAGIAAIAADLWLASDAARSPGVGLADRAAFLGSAAGVRIVADFAALAAFAGFYVTPLNAALQLAAPPARRARFVACSNVVDAAAMTLSAALTAACVAAGLGALDVMALFGSTGAFVALVVAAGPRPADGASQNSRKG
jgi:MFS family permease